MESVVKNEKIHWNEDVPPLSVEVIVNIYTNGSSIICIGLPGDGLCHYIQGRSECQKILKKQIEKQYGLAASAYACYDFYLTVPHTVDQSVNIGISFNHAFHLVLGTKSTELLC